jgi:hypothetical protein
MLPRCARAHHQMHAICFFFFFCPRGCAQASAESVFGEMEGTLALLPRDETDFVDVISETHMFAFSLLAAYVGTPDGPRTSVPELTEYLQSAFGISNDARDAAFKTASRRVSGQAGAHVQLRVNLVRATGVVGKDIDGLSDPCVAPALLRSDGAG